MNASHDCATPYAPHAVRAYKDRKGRRAHFCMRVKQIPRVVETLSVRTANSLIANLIGRQFVLHPRLAHFVAELRLTAQAVTFNSSLLAVQFCIALLDGDVALSSMKIAHDWRAALELLSITSMYCVHARTLVGPFVKDPSWRALFEEALPLMNEGAGTHNTNRRGVLIGAIMCMTSDTMRGPLVDAFNFEIAVGSLACKKASQSLLECLARHAPNFVSAESRRVVWHAFESPISASFVRKINKARK